MRKGFRTAAAMILIAVMLCGTAGCAKSGNGDDRIIKAKAADLMKGVTPGEVTVDAAPSDFGASVNDFSLRLFRESNKAAKDGENTLVSPLSVLLALSMTANGAQAETLTQMEAVLGMPVDKLNEFAYSYMHSLPKDRKFYGALSIADSIWFKADPDFTADRDFLQTNADYYDAQIYSAPFDGKTLKDINKWVKDKTDGMIPTILDSIPESAIMYLINAMAFDAEWRDVYKDYQVQDGIFTTAGGTDKRVPFMYSEVRSYLEDEGAVGFLRYYKGGRYAFAALLPNEGKTPAEYLETLTGEHLSDMLANVQNCKVATALPKFKTEYSVEMSGILQSMGMTQAFDMENADFGKMGTVPPDRNISIGRVLHKTVIEVTERGTRAGAATVVEMLDGTAAMPEERKEVYLNRPFIYMLIDCDAGIPFFIGVMNDPQ